MLHCLKTQVYADKDEVVVKIYNCSDLTPIRPTVEIPNTKNKPPHETFGRFGNKNFDETCMMMGIKPLNSSFRTNICQMSEELCQYYEDLIDSPTTLFPRLSTITERQTNKTRAGFKPRLLERVRHRITDVKNNSSSKWRQTTETHFIAIEYPKASS